MDKYLEDRWMRKGMGKANMKDGQSQLTLGSFQVRSCVQGSCLVTDLTFYRVCIPTFVRRTVFCTHYYSMVSIILLVRAEYVFYPAAEPAQWPLLMASFFFLSHLSIFDWTKGGIFKISPRFLKLWL